MEPFQNSLHLWIDNSSSKSGNEFCNLLTKNEFNDIDNFTADSGNVSEKSVSHFGSKNCPKIGNEWHRPVSSELEGHKIHDSECFHEISDDHDSDNESSQSDVSINFSLSLKLESEKANTMNSSKMIEVNANINNTKEIQEDLESSLQLPPLDTLPIRPVEISSQSSFVSFASYSKSTEDLNNEKVCIHQKLSCSKQLSENPHFCFDMKAEMSSTSLDQSRNASYMISESGHGTLRKTHLQNSDEDLSPLSFVHTSTNLTSDSTSLNQVTPTNDNRLQKGISSPDVLDTLKNVNLNNIIINETLKPDHLVTLPPLPPRRRSRTLSSCTMSQEGCAARSATPPASYQRHELLVKKQETDSDEFQEISGRFCFPYPSLVRFPPLRYSTSNNTKKITSVQEPDARTSIDEQKTKDETDKKGHSQESKACEEELLLNDHKSVANEVQEVTPELSKKLERENDKDEPLLSCCIVI